MKRHNRHRSSPQSLAYPVKHFLQRFSLIILFAGGLGLLSLGRLAPQLLEDIRIRFMDITATTLDVVATPWDSFLALGRSINELFYLQVENDYLRRENQHLKTEVLEARNVFYENKELSRLLDMTKVLPKKVHSARVIGNTSTSFFRSAIIDAGANDNVRKGEAVINDQGLIGRVIEVGASSSRILLLADVNSRVPVRLTKSRLRAILAGKNGEKLELLYLPPEHHLSIGEMIVTTGDGHIFPAGIPVAVVDAVSPKVTVVPLASFSKLDFVSIIQP